MVQNQPMTGHGLTIVRSFKATKAKVFNAFANADSLAEWWGPAGSSITVISFDFQPGGKFHYKLEGGGQVMWGRFIYGNITRPDSIEFTSSFSDEAGNICKSPFPMDFPLEIFNSITLHEENGMTILTLTGHPVNATGDQQATYQSIIPNMEQGFAGTFAKLEEYLSSNDSELA